jgi:hypothetical protein
MSKQNVYHLILDKIFFDHYKKVEIEFFFDREEISKAAKFLKIKEPGNDGDVIYSSRYRGGLPDSISNTAPNGFEWVIEGVAKSKYKFKLFKTQKIEPNQNMVAIKIPDSTPEIIKAYSFDDEQATLAKIRYNRLLDIFLGITTYSVQNHLRTTVINIGQIEIDEIYVGIDKKGRHYIIPVQAKGGKDKIGTIQTKQDIAYCADNYKKSICRAVSVYRIDSRKIAMFELTIDNDEVKIAEERHYILAPHSDISETDLDKYNIGNE